MSGTLTSAARKLPKLQRYADRGIDLTAADLVSHRELHMTFHPLPRETPDELIRRVAAVLNEHDASVVRHEVFGSIAAYPETVQALRHEVSQFNWPVMWIEGHASNGYSIAGMHVFAVAGTGVQTICMEDRPVGRIFCEGPVQHCFLADMKSSDPSSSRKGQCSETFAKIEGALRQAGMTPRNVTRTWFYLEDICRDELLFEVEVDALSIVDGTTISTSSSS